MIFTKSKWTPEKFHYGNSEIECVKSIQYLGFNISYNFNIKVTIQDRQCKASKMSNLLAISANSPVTGVPQKIHHPSNLTEWPPLHPINLLRVVLDWIYTSWKEALRFSIMLYLCLYIYYGNIPVCMPNKHCLNVQTGLVSVLIYTMELVLLGFVESRQGVHRR